MVKEFKSIENLINYLNLTLDELNEIIERIKDYKEYFNYLIPKRNGSYRLISAPSNRLKKIQKKLLDSFNNIYNRKKCSYGFEKKRNNIDCASKHCRKKYICTIDLKDFFNQITSYRVFGMLVNKPYEINEKVCSVLTDLVCRNDKLPQGAPTSPILANMLLKKLDFRLIKFAKANRITYSRYADDLIFSSYKDFSHLIFKNASQHYELSLDFKLIFESFNMEINENKIKYSCHNSRQMVTGLIVNKFPNIKNSDYRILRTILYNYSKNPIETAKKYREIKKLGVIKAEQDLLTWFESVLYGKILYFRNIKGENRQFYKLTLSYNSRVEYCNQFDVNKLQVAYDEVENYCFIVNVINGEKIRCGTGFYIKDLGYITSAHLFNIKNGSIDDYDDVTLEFKGKVIQIMHEWITINVELDYAIIQSACLFDNLLYFDIENNRNMKTYDLVRVLGFPDTAQGGIPLCDESHIINLKYKFNGIDIVIISRRTIYKGMSGGPVLNINNRIIGIAQIGGNYEDIDNQDLCGFIPINLVVNDIENKK